MKLFFKAHQIPVVDGYRVQTDAEIQATFVKLGFPLIAKPDNGVGASDTHKIVDKESLDNFIANRHHGTAYFMESFIHGNIVTFDGLTDQDGKVVFYSSMSYSEPALETLEGHHEMYFYEDRKVAPDVRKYGLKAVKAFEIKERFFHIEFFRLADGTLYALEVNCRPAGGSSIDLMNYGHEINLFEAYAQIVTQNHFTQEIKNNYYSTYFSRFNGHEYAHSLEDIQTKYGQYLKEIQHIPDAFSDVMGNIGLIFNTEAQETIAEISRYVDELK